MQRRFHKGTRLISTKVLGDSLIGAKKIPKKGPRIFPNRCPLGTEKIIPRVQGDSPYSLRGIYPRFPRVFPYVPGNTLESLKFPLGSSGDLS